MSYILHHLELVWAFVRGDDEALYRIDATPRGALLSFLAILIVEPLSFFYAALFGFFDQLLPFQEGGMPFYLLQLLLDWGTAPVVFFLFCTLFGYRDRFIPLLVSSNWLSVIILMLMLIPGALMTSMLIGASFSLLLMMAVYGFAIWISYRLYRFVLDCPPGMALGLAVLMLILSVISALVMADVATTFA